MHILLVEDSDHDIFFVRHALKRIAHRVELSVTKDGAQALDFLARRAPYTQASPPSIILLDLNMPRKSGFDVLATLGQDPRLKCIPTIVLTTSARPEDIARCYELGANAYLSKPLGLEELYTVLQATVDFWRGCQLRPLA